MAVQVQEHRRLFKFRGISSHVVKGKGQVKTEEKPYMCHQVFLLSNPHVDRPPPSLAARTALSSAELANSAAMFAQRVLTIWPENPEILV